MRPTKYAGVAPQISPYRTMGLRADSGHSAWHCGSGNRIMAADGSEAEFGSGRESIL